MGFRFPSGAYARRYSPAYLNDQDKFSCACWVLFDSLTTAKQYVWSHRGVQNQISLRKFEGASAILRFSVTCGGVNRTVDSTTVLTVGVAYHVFVTWEKNVEMKIYVNGVLEATSSVANFHTVNYDSSDDTTPILWGVRSEISDPMLGVIEGWQFFDRQLLTVNQIASIALAGWPWKAAATASEAHFFAGHLRTELPDFSGQQRHVLAADIVGAVADGGTIGKWEEPEDSGIEGRKIAVAAGGAQAAAWTVYGTEPVHPVSSLVVSGLTDGTTYELVVVAFNAAGESPEQSVPAVATPNDATIRHTPKKLFVG